MVRIGHAWSSIVLVINFVESNQITVVFFEKVRERIADVSERRAWIVETSKLFFLGLRMNNE